MVNYWYKKCNFVVLLCTFTKNVTSIGHFLKILGSVSSVSAMAAISLAFLQTLSANFLSQSAHSVFSSLSIKFMLVYALMMSIDIACNIILKGFVKLRL